MLEDEGTLRILRELDEATQWELPRDLQPVEPIDDSVVPVSAEGGICTEEEGELDGPESVDNILSCVTDMEAEGDIEDVLIVVNTKDGDQLLFTTIERNDLIIGCLATAQMNWHTYQLSLQNEEGIHFEEEEGEEV